VFRKKICYSGWILLILLLATGLQISYAHASVDPITTALEKCAATNFKDQAAITRIFVLLDITTKEHENKFLEKIATVAESHRLNTAKFVNKLKDLLDKKRFKKVNALLEQVYKHYGKGLNVVVRTGSSGYRHLQLARKRTNHAGYRLLFSDDDISFVGKEAVGAAKYFNELLEREGLEKLKVKGFDIVHLKNIRNIDLNLLNLLESEKFVGEAAMSGIKKEMLVKGAVIAENQGGKLVAHAEPLSAFIKNKVDNVLANELSEKAIRGIVKKRGAMTMIGSCERQITGAHGGWEKLSDEHKAIITAATEEMTGNMLQEFRYKNAKALQELPSNVQIKTFPKEMMEAAKSALKDVLTDESKKSADFKRVLESYQAFAKLNKPWDDISTKNFLEIRS